MYLHEKQYPMLPRTFVEDEKDAIKPKINKKVITY